MRACAHFQLTYLDGFHISEFVNPVIMFLFLFLYFKAIFNNIYFFINVLPNVLNNHLLFSMNVDTAKI